MPAVGVGKAGAVATKGRARILAMERLCALAGAWHRELHRCKQLQRREYTHTQTRVPGKLVKSEEDGGVHPCQFPSVSFGGNWVKGLYYFLQPCVNQNYL